MKIDQTESHWLRYTGRCLLLPPYSCTNIQCFYRWSIWNLSVFKSLTFSTTAAATASYTGAYDVSWSIKALHFLLTSSTEAERKNKSGFETQILPPLKTGQNVDFEDGNHPQHNDQPVDEAQPARKATGFWTSQTRQVPHPAIPPPLLCVSP